jgi:hypothetical protein
MEKKSNPELTSRIIFLGQKYFLAYFSVADPGSDAFLTPGSGIWDGKYSTWIGDKHPPLKKHVSK